MTTETILTNQEISNIWSSTIEEWGLTFQQFVQVLQFARAIKQTVLQSEQVQAWKRDAERMEWYFGSADKSPWMYEYMRGCNEGWSVDQWRTSIDAAMEKQK